MQRTAFLATTGSIMTAALTRTAAAQTPALMNLRVAATANDTYATAYYAQDMGFYTKAGLNAEVQTMNNGAAIASAVSAGSMDVGVATPAVLANASLHGLPIVIVAAGAMSSPDVLTVALCVPPNSTLKTAKDFEGKTIAVNALHAGVEVNLDAWLAQGHADATKVKLVEITFSAMGQSVESGRVDAAVMTEPAMTVALGENHLKVLTNLDKGIAPTYISSCWFAMKDFAQKNPELMRRFQNATYATQKWANAHHPETAAILSKYSKMDLSLAQRMGPLPLRRVDEDQRHSGLPRRRGKVRLPLPTRFRCEPDLPALTRVSRGCP